MNSTGSDLYSLPQEHLDFRRAVRALATDRVAPRAADIDRDDEYPRDLRELLAEHDVLALPARRSRRSTRVRTRSSAW